MDKDVFKDMTYGMFVLSTKYKNKDVGCFVNTAVQITSVSMLVAVSVNKNNFTNEAIKNTKKFAIAILSENTNAEVIGKFGFFSSKDTNKFEGFEAFENNGILIINENICSYMVCELVEVISADTHDVFIAKVIDAKKLNNFKPMTYSFYHKVIKGSAPKSAPTFIEEKNLNKGNFKKYKCTICGHIYDEEIEKVSFSDLPETWKCPICGVGKEMFEEMK